MTGKEGKTLRKDRLIGLKEGKRKGRKKTEKPKRARKEARNYKES